MRSWLQSAQVYRDRRVLSLLFLGFSSGLPFGVLADPLSAWLVDEGVSKTTIGLFALVSLPYAVKFMWSPLMDKLALPLFTPLFGRRRGWVLFTQLLLLAAIFAMGLTQPGIDPWWTAVFALAVAFSSASQDIVVDAYRIEILSEEKLAAGAATAVFGWRLGQVGTAAAGLIFADMFPWQSVFMVMAALVGVGIVAILINPEPDVEITPEAEQREQAVEEFLERKQHLPTRLAETLGLAVRRGGVSVRRFHDPARLGQDYLVYSSLQIR